MSKITTETIYSVTDDVLGTSIHVGPAPAACVRIYSADDEYNLDIDLDVEMAKALAAAILKKVEEIEKKKSAR